MSKREKLRELKTQRIEELSEEIECGNEEEEEMLKTLKYFERGNLYLQLNQFEKAIEDLSISIKNHPNHARSYQKRGDCYKKLKNLKNAMDDYTKMIELDPNHFLGYFNRGLLFMTLKENKNAIDDFTKSIEINYRHKFSYYNRARIYQQMNEHRPAIIDFCRVLMIDRSYFTAYNHRGLLYLKLKYYTAARNDFTKAIEKKSKSKFIRGSNSIKGSSRPDTSSYYVNRAVVHLKTSSFEKAIHDLDKSIQINPNLGSAYFNRGLAHKKLSNFQQSITDLSKCLELEPKHTMAYLTRSQIYYYHIKDLKKSMMDCIQCSRLNRRVWGVYIIKAKILRDLGRVELAKKEMECLLRANPGNHEAVELLKLLDQKVTEVDDNILPELLVEKKE